MSVDDLYKKLQERWAANDRSCHRLYICLGILVFLHVVFSLVF